MAAGKAKLQNNGLEIHNGFGSVFLRPQALNVVLCGNHHLICTYADAAPTSLSNFSSFLTTASTAKAVRPTATTPIMEATHCAPALESLNLCSPTLYSPRLYSEGYSCTCCWRYFRKCWVALPLSRPRASRA